MANIYLYCTHTHVHAQSPDCFSKVWTLAYIYQRRTVIQVNDIKAQTLLAAPTVTNPTIKVIEDLFLGPPLHVGDNSCLEITPSTAD